MKENTAITTPGEVGEIDFGGRLWGPRELMSLAWKTFKGSFWKILLAYILPWIVIGALGFLLVLVSGTTFFLSGGKPAILFIMGGLWLFIMVVVIPWQNLGILYLIDGARTGIGIKEAYAKARKKIFFYWGLMILQGLLVMGAYVPLLIPGIILAVSFTFAVYVLAFEDIKGFNALMRSREYVKGRWWAVVGRQLYVGLIYIALAILVSILSAILSGGNKEVMNSTEKMLNVITLPLTPLIMTYMYFMYKNLKSITPAAETQVKMKFRWTLLAVWGGVIGLVLILAMIGWMTLLMANPLASSALFV